MDRTFKRDELYDLVWSKPVKTLAGEFGISDVGLSKLCKAHDIPLPPRGYWAKFEAGKRVAKAALPKRGIGMRDVVGGGSNNNYWYYRNTPRDLVDAEIGAAPSFDEPIEEVVGRVRKSVGKVSIPRDFTRAHRLIAKLLERDDERRTKYLAMSYRSSWDAPFFDSPFEKRRLRLMNALMISSQRSGSNPGFREQNPAGFTYRVGHQDLSVTIDHPKQDRYSFRGASDLARPASDTLRVTIHAQMGNDFRTQWEDAPDRRVEASVEEIAIAMVVAGEVQYRTTAVSHHDWLITRKAQLIEERRARLEEARQREIERLAAEERARIESLLADASAHRQANEIRAYVASVRHSVGSSNGTVGQLDEWTRWATTQADRLDPISSGRWVEQSLQLADGSAGDRCNDANGPDAAI